MTDLFLLPDELWISILSEWIVKPITLCAFDISFCNNLLRQRYLTCWLHAVTFGIFSQVHFEPVFAAIGSNKPSVPVKFFDWCEKRNIFPVSLSYQYEMMRNDKGEWECAIPSKVLNAMKFVEKFNGSCTINSNDSAIFYLGFVFPLNILDHCPKLKHLSFKSSFFFVIHCEHGPYALRTLELYGVCLVKGKFYDLISACPMLEVVKLHKCPGIRLHHVQYLLHHAIHVESIFVSFVSHNIADTNLTSQNIEAVGNQVVLCSSMKSLILMNIHTVIDNINSISNQLLPILRNCSMLEELIMSGINYDMRIVVEDWCEVMASAWQHLHTLNLCNSHGMIKNETLLHSIGNCCGNHMLHLSIKYNLSRAIIVMICASFPILQSLELCDTSTDMPLYEMICWFQQALFRHTLRYIKLDIFLNCWVKLDCALLWDCFPALKAIDVKVSPYMTLFTPFHRIHVITRLSLSFSERNSYSCTNKDWIAQFVHLQHLTISKMNMPKTMLRTILTLPALRYLCLKNVYQYNQFYSVKLNIRQSSIFHPGQYPVESTELSPLRTFEYIATSDIDQLYELTEEMLRVFLQRFIHLERMQVKRITMEEKVFQQVQQEYRYRTIISKLI